MFMNEKEYIDYRMEKFKDNFFIVYSTFLIVAAFMALVVLCV